MTEDWVIYQLLTYLLAYSRSQTLDCVWKLSMCCTQCQSNSVALFRLRPCLYFTSHVSGIKATNLNIRWCDVFSEIEVWSLTLIWVVLLRTNDDAVVKIATTTGNSLGSNCKVNKTHSLWVLLTSYNYWWVRRCKVLSGTW